MLGGGRFTGGLDPLMVKYNESIFFDRVLYKQDILGSIAFARANAKSRRSGRLAPSPSSLEDIHTANEHRLGEIVGKNVAGKLHTGRSRNEQVLIQRPQPVRWNHWMLSYGLAFASDLERLRETIQRVNRSPLGCGALAGNPFDIDRDMMAEDLILLYRRKESLEPMMDHVKTVSDSIQIANGVLSTLNVQPDKMRAALDPFMLATDVADYLVRKGVPFRETHHVSGRYVAKSEETSIPMNEFSYEQIKAIDERFEEDIADAFNYEASIESRSAKGGTSKATVLEQIEVLRKMLA
ncbi:hypothetical protein ACJ41O_011480 [Fusarium nematophilum]